MKKKNKNRWLLLLLGTALCLTSSPMTALGAGGFDAETTGFTAETLETPEEGTEDDGYSEEFQFHTAPGGIIGPNSTETDIKAVFNRANTKDDNVIVDMNTKTITLNNSLNLQQPLTFAGGDWTLDFDDEALINGNNIPAVIIAASASPNAGTLHLEASEDPKSHSTILNSPFEDAAHIYTAPYATGHTDFLHVGRGYHAILSPNLSMRETGGTSNSFIEVKDGGIATANHHYWWTTIKINNGVVIDLSEEADVQSEGPSLLIRKAGNDHFISTMQPGKDPLTLTANLTIEPSWSVTIEGSLKLDGCTLTNQGTITVPEGSGMHLATGSTLINEGTIHSSGTLSQEPGSTVTNAPSGRIVNSTVGAWSQVTGTPAIQLADLWITDSTNHARTCPVEGCELNGHTVPATPHTDGNGDYHCDICGYSMTPPPPVYYYYTLTFDTGGGSTLPAITRIEGSTLSLEDYRPQKEGYYFTGWFADTACTDPVTQVTLWGNRIVYAGWTPMAALSPKEEDLVTGTLLPVTPDGTGSLALPQENLTEALEAMKELAEESGRTHRELTVPVTAPLQPGSLDRLSFLLPHEDLLAMTEGGLTQLTYSLPDGTELTLDADTLSSLTQTSEKGDLLLILSARAANTGLEQRVMSSRSLYTLTLTCLTPGAEEEALIPDFGGSITLSQPAVLTETEAPEQLYSLRLAPDNAFYWERRCCDPDSKVLTLTFTEPTTRGAGHLSLQTAPAAPADKTPKSMTLTWEEDPLAEGYTIWYRSEEEDTLRRKILKGARTTSWKRGNLEPGTKYFYSVRPWVLTEEGYVFGDQLAPIRGTTKPETTQIQSVTLTDDGRLKVKLAGPAQGAERYSLCWSSDKDFNDFTVGIRTSYTTRTLTKNPGPGIWYLRVKPYRDLGNHKRIYADWSAPVKINIS